MWAALGIVAVAVVGAEPHLSATAAVSARTFARSAIGDTPGAHAGLELEPRGALRLRLGTLTGSVHYSPTLLLGGAAGPSGGVTTLAHSAALRTEWSPRRGLQTSAYATGRLGFPDLIARGPDGSLSLAPRPTFTADQLESTVGVTVWTELTRRLSASASVGYWMGGGTTTAARQLLPWATSPYLATELSYALSRRDTLRTELHLSGLELSTGESATVVRAGERWRRDLTRSLRGEVVAGAGVAFTAGQPRAATGAPWLGAALTHSDHWGRQEVRTRADIELLPAASRYTSQVYPRAQLLGAAETDLADRVTVGFRAGAAVAATPALEQEELFVGEVRARWQATPELSLEGNAAARRDVAPSLGPAWHWAVTAGLTWAMKDGG